MSNTSKGWRTNPKVRNAEVRYLIMAPFAVVAYINKGNFIHVGISRCSPLDTFNEEMGEQVAGSRARLQYAYSLGLLPERRTRAIERNIHSQPNAMMCRVTPLQFKKLFKTRP